jgi:hypothetical protein
MSEFPTLAVLSSVNQRTIRTIYMRIAYVYNTCVQHILLFRHWQFFLLLIKKLLRLRLYVQKKIQSKKNSKIKKIQN